MIYMVECAYTDPAREAAWNAFYDDDKLPTLLALPGFRASQRFRAIAEMEAPYLAIHSIRDAAVLAQPEYRAVGGGTFSGWDDDVANWKRNLFAGMETAPEVAAEARVVLLDEPAAAADAPGVEFAWLDCVGLDRTADRRGVAVVGREEGEALARERPGPFRVYAPLGPRQAAPGFGS